MSTDARPSIASLAIELTTECNQRCAYCYNEPGRRDPPNVPLMLARVERILAEVDVRDVVLTGGEPLMYPGLFDVIELLRRRGLVPRLISNATLATDELALLLAQAGVRAVQATLNGPTPELHELSNGAGTFERVLSGIAALRRHGLEVTGCIVVSRRNARQISGILDVFRELGVRRVALSRFSPSGKSVKLLADLLPSRTDLTQALELAEPYGSDGMQIFSTMPVPPCAVEIERFPSLRFGTCSIGTAEQQFVLGVDGALRNCPLHSRPLGAGEDIADASVSIVGLVRGPDVMGYRCEVPEFCVGCIHAESCGGGCGAAAYSLFGHARRFADPLVLQHIDDDFGARLAAARANRHT